MIILHDFINCFDVVSHISVITNHDTELRQPKLYKYFQHKNASIKLNIARLYMNESPFHDPLFCC